MVVCGRMALGERGAHLRNRAGRGYPSTRQDSMRRRIRAGQGRDLCQLRRRRGRTDRER